MLILSGEMTTPKYLIEVYDIISQAKSPSDRKLANNTQLIGHVPHVAPEAFLHLIFPPLTQKDVEYMENQLGKEIPVSLKTFYIHHNGISLFSGALSIYGLRENYDRTGDNVWQPFDLLVTNTFESPEGFKPNHILIGGFREDGSRLYVDNLTGKIYRRSRTSSKPLNEWSSFDEMLLSETIRLSKLFDKKGKLLGDIKSTLPTAGR
jgi:hypothetical protein